MQDVTFCIKTFDRPKSLNILLQSIHRLYPGVPVLVANDGSERDLRIPEKDHTTLIIDLPYDTGLSAGRNALIDACQTPIMYILEDDFVFHAPGKVDHLAMFVHSSVFDVAGGSLVSKAGREHFEGFLRYENGGLTCRHQRQTRNPARMDIVLNFFAVRTEIAKRVRWDDELKLGEHYEFFLRCQEQGVRVGYVPWVWAEHRRTDPNGYRAMRNEKAMHYREVWMKKRGISGVMGSLSN